MPPTVLLEDERSKIEIIFDKWGIPHIYADDLRSMAFGDGYAQAHDRLWQMDFNRRVGQGRLSEVLGQPALEADRLARYAGFERIAREEYSILGTEEKILLDGFTDGVNHYIEAHRNSLPIEFNILKDSPKPWKPTDSLAFYGSITWYLHGNWSFETLGAWMIEKFGREVAGFVGNPYPAGKPVIVPAGAMSAKPKRLVDEEMEMEKTQLVAPPAQMNSNNWVVGGEKSETGGPLLANDTHLPLEIPGIWHEAHIQCPEAQAIGAELPGLPGVIIGHNGHIAWGFTNAVVDASDLFVEKLRGEPERPQYQHRGAWKDAEVLREEIVVRGRSEPVVENVVVTGHGPIISPLYGEPQSLAVKSILSAVEVHTTKALIGLWKARDWNMFRDAMRNFRGPAQNAVYADAEGNIGFQLVGLVPMRGRGHGLVPSPGWTDEYDWTGYVPFENLPSEYNPSTHWIASANNKIVNDDFPFYLGSGGAFSRVERIVQLLQSKERLSVADFKRMQTDLFSARAKEIVEAMERVEASDDRSREALRILRNWDYVLSPESVAASIFEVFSGILMRRALRAKLDQEATEVWLGKPRGKRQEFHMGSAWLAERIKEYPEWFGKGGWARVMNESLVSAVEELTRMLGENMSDWKWKRLHTQTFKHPLGQIPDLAKMVNRGPVVVGGDAETVWANGFIPITGFAAAGVGAAYRQIIDLRNLDKSLAVLPAGQSGDPRSVHYDDMIELWRKGDYHPLLWTRGEVEKYAASRENLRTTNADTTLFA